MPGSPLIVIRQSNRELRSGRISTLRSWLLPTSAWSTLRIIRPQIFPAVNSKRRSAQHFRQLLRHA